MRPRRVALLAAVLACAAAAAAGSGASDPARRTVYPAAFSDGSGRAIAERSCILCHAPTLITQQAKDSTGWEKTIGLMEKWGAPLAPGERDTLRGYLVERFGPRPPRPR